MTAVRRATFLGGLAGAASGVLMAPRQSVAQSARRIDVHHHYASPMWLELARKTGKLEERFWNPWSVQKSLEEMDKNGVATAVISVTFPGINFGDDATARALARECNEFAAKTVATYRGRFGMFVGLPLPDIAGSLREIAYGMDVLKADGVGLFTSYTDKWLGDPYFAPIYAELDRRKAVVFVHPTTAACCTNLVPTINDSEIEYGTDTSRAIARMVFAGFANTYPNIRVIFSHGGGTMPYLNERFVHWGEVPQFKPLMPNGFLFEARKFYYDVAQTTTTASLSALTKIIPTSHIVFGSDYPYITIGENVAGVRDSGLFSPSDLAAIDRGNFATLVPHYA
jgi:6-methylsalicylate decarboxylase